MQRDWTSCSKNILQQETSSFLLPKDSVVASWKNAFPFLFWSYFSKKDSPYLCRLAP